MVRDWDRVCFLGGQGTIVKACWQIEEILSQIMLCSDTLEHGLIYLQRFPRVALVYETAYFSF